MLRRLDKEEQLQICRLPWMTKHLAVANPTPISPLILAAGMAIMATPFGRGGDL
jgi:hypothetical protein